MGVAITVSRDALPNLTIRIRVPANAIESQLFKPAESLPPVLPGVVIGYPLQQLDRPDPDILLFVEEA